MIWSFPDERSCLGLVRGPAIETNDEGLAFLRPATGTSFQQFSLRENRAVLGAHALAPTTSENAPLCSDSRR
jgi:hypothetical protein